MTAPRPKTMTPTIAEAIGTELANDLDHVGCLPKGVGGKDEIARQIATVASSGMDGFELAIALKARYQWDIYFDIVEVLENFSCCLDRELKKAQEAWVAVERIEPSFEAGSRIALPSGETGVITGIYEHGPAKYSVAIDGDPDASGPTNARRIVNFEDAALIAEAV